MTWDTMVSVNFAHHWVPIATALSTDCLCLFVLEHCHWTSRLVTHLTIAVSRPWPELGNLPNSGVRFCALQNGSRRRLPERSVLLKKQLKYKQNHPRIQVTWEICSVSKFVKFKIMWGVEFNRYIFQNFWNLTCWG